MVDRSELKDLDGRNFDPKVSEKILSILKTDLSYVETLVSEHYAEKYLLPNYSSQASVVLGIAAILSYTDNLSIIKNDREFDFKSFVSDLFCNCLTEDEFGLEISLRCAGLIFQHTELQQVRQSISSFVSIGMWFQIPEKWRIDLFEAHPALQKPWKKSVKKYQGLESTDRAIIQRDWFYLLHEKVFSAPTERLVSSYLDLIIVTLQQIPTRRYLLTLYQSLLVIPKLEQLKLHGLASKVNLLKFYMHFPFDEFTGEELTHSEAVSRYTEKIYKLQNLAYSYKDNQAFLSLALANFSSISGDLEDLLNGASDQDLAEFSAQLGITQSDSGISRPLLLKGLTSYATCSLWDIPFRIDYGALISDPEFIKPDSLLPEMLAVKATAQYLSLREFWLRQFLIYRRIHLLAVRKMLDLCLKDLKSGIAFNSYQADSMKGGVCKIEDVVLKSQSSNILADPGFIKVHMEATCQLPKQYEGQRSNEVVLLAFFDGEKIQRLERCNKFQVMSNAGSRSLARKAEFGENNSIESDYSNHKGSRGALKILMETDLKEANSDFNFLIFIEDANFETVDLLRSSSLQNASLPPWLSDIFLGFGIAGSSEIALPESLDVYELLSDAEVAEKALQITASADCTPPFMLAKPLNGRYTQLRSLGIDGKEPPSFGSFTDNETQAIVSSAISPLSVISRKSDASQRPANLVAHIIYILTKNFSAEKTLIISKRKHSIENVFQELVSMGIDPTHLLLLGQKGLFGYEHMLSIKSELLDQISRLAVYLGFSNGYGNSCSTALLFWKKIILPLMEEQNEDKLKGLISFFNLSSKEMLNSKLLSIFDKLGLLEPLEVLRGTYRQDWMSRSKGTQVIGCDIKDIPHILSKNINYKNIVIMDSESIPEAQSTALFHSGIQRLILLGDERVPTESGTYSRTNCHQSLFSRLLLLPKGSAPIYEITDYDDYRPELGPRNTGSHVIRDFNPGLLYVSQFLNISGTEEMNESYDYSNLEEAKYAVLLYQYLRLLGYPNEKISICTPYHAQCAIISKLLSRNLSDDLRKKIFGMPSVGVSGHLPDNDYVLFSAVRSSTSNLACILPEKPSAKLGFYMIGNQSIFGSNEQVLDIISHQKDGILQVVVGELFSLPERKNTKGIPIVGLEHLDQYVREMTNQRLQFERSRKPAVSS